MTKTNPTKQKGSIILYVVIFIAVVVIIYTVVMAKKPKKTEIPTEAAAAAGTEAAPAAAETKTTKEETVPGFNPNKVLKRGSSGEEVAYVQKAINRVRKLKNLNPIGVDGDFGPETEAAVTRFMGTKSTTYAKVKGAVIYTFKAAGKPDPYAHENSTNGVPWFMMPW